MSPSKIFILRPVATSLLMVAILLVGIIAYRQLPVSALPQVDYPTMQVLTFYPGAGPSVTESSVTAPLERQFGQIPGLKQMTSTSTFGASLIILEFDLDMSIDIAEQQVQSAINVLYESYIHPLTILSTLPSAGVGAILALQLFHLDLSIMGLIGIVLLIGIVKKNAIMMIDFALDAERNRGMSPEESIYQACLLRFRPIMMTTMAALFGGIPLAIGRGTGSELRHPLGIAIVGGLLISQVLTLFTTPAVYLFFDRLARRVRPVQAGDVVEAPGPAD